MQLNKMWNQLVSKLKLGVLALLSYPHQPLLAQIYVIVTTSDM